MQQVFLFHKLFPIRLCDVGNSVTTNHILSTVYVNTSFNLWDNKLETHCMCFRLDLHHIRHRQLHLNELIFGYRRKTRNLYQIEVWRLLGES